MTRQNTVHQESLRSINIGLALQSILLSKTPPNRAQVAASIGAARSTAGTLVDELISWGLIEEREAPEQRKRGRPGKLLVPSSGKVAAIGVEINVAILAVKVIDVAGNVLAKRFIYDDFRGVEPSRAVDMAMGLIEECLGETDAEVNLVGTSFAVPGMVDSQTEHILVAPNLGWPAVDLVGLARQAGLSGKISVFNEADCAALTVSQNSPGQPSELQDFLYVSGEVGIGSAYVTEGVVRTGKHGWAGELGHVCVDAIGAPCACGSTGCLEVYAGQRAMCAAAQVASIEELLSKLKLGDKRCEQTVRKAVISLGVAISAAMNLLDISTIVFGGHLGRLADYLVKPTMEELRTRVLWGDLSSFNIIPIRLDSGKRATGAAFAVLNQVLKNPAAFAASVS